MDPLFDLSSYETPFETVQLIRACGGCRQKTWVKARYLVARNAIEALCPCGQRFWLRQDEYPDAFPDIERRRRKYRLNHDDKEFEPLESPYKIFNRYAYRCIYHEGSEEAKKLRLAHLDALASRMPASQTTLNIADPRLREAVAGDAFSPDQFRNLFGLVPDHLIPRSYTRRFESQMTERQLRLCKQEWIVAACTYCNEERGNKIERADTLLFLYSRYVMIHRGRNAFERLADANEFLRVLEILAKGIYTEDARREAFPDTE